MTRKKNKPKSETVHPTATSGVPWSMKKNPLMQKKWFAPALFCVLALFYFAPYMSLNKIIMGTDDGPRGWHTIGNHGHGIESFWDKWSPLNGGTVIMERRFGRFINPTHLFHLIMPKYKARTLEYVFWTFVAGYCMFLFLRILGISAVICYICSIAFMYGPAFQSYIFGGHFARMEVIALLPGVMFFTELMLRKTSLLAVAGLAALLALAYYSEHVQLAYFVSLGMGLYFAIRMIHIVFIKKEISVMVGAKRTGFFTAALVFGLLLTAMTSFPSIHHTNVTSKRAGGVDYEYASSFALHPEEILSLFEPDFIGWKESYWGQNPLKLNNEYFGVLFLICAIMLFVIRKQDFQKYLFAGIFIFAVLFTLGAHTPVHRIAYYLVPGMKAFRAPSFMYIWFVLSGFVLAAYALDILSAYSWNDNPALNKRLIIFAGIVCGFAFLYMLAAEPFSTFWYNSIFPAELQHERKYNALMHHMSSMKLGALITFLFVAAFFTILYLKTRGIINQQLFITLFLVIACIDVIRISRPFLSQSIKPKNYFDRQEKVEESIERYLHQRDKTYYRVHSMLGDQKMYIPDLEMMYIFDDFINKQYYDIVQIALSAGYALQQPQYAANKPLHDRFRNALSVLNTKYILSLSPLSVTGLKEVINSGGLRIYEDVHAFPRFYTAYHILPESDTQKAMMTLIDTPDLQQTTAVVEKEIWGDKTLAPGIDTTVENAVTVKKYDTRKGHTTVTVTSDREQLLVIAENYNDGWTATINETPAEVFRVNHYAKGVIVPRGTSEVELVYESARATFWRKVTLISFILFLIFTGFAVFIHVRSMRKEQNT